jgi:hypothetical protein
MEYIEMCIFFFHFLQERKLVHIICPIPAKKFRPPFSCHLTEIGCSLTFIVVMIDVRKLKFEIYNYHL